MLRGFVDRLDRNAAGETRVVDYKTGKAPGEGFEQKALFQMRFYALVLWRATGTLPRLLQLLYLGSEHVLRYEPDEADLLATERKVKALWAAIQRGARDRRLAALARRACATGATTSRGARPSAALPRRFPRCRSRPSTAQVPTDAPEHAARVSVTAATLQPPAPPRSPRSTAPATRV